MTAELLPGEFERIHAELRDWGWVTLALPSKVDLRIVLSLLRPDLIPYASRFHVNRISPKTHDCAPTGTLSARYGLGSFPFHTERAHWKNPPRYIAFRSIGAPTDRPTTLVDSYDLDASSDLVRDLHCQPWDVRWEEVKFESPVLTPVSSAPWKVRYDPCCMAIKAPHKANLESALEQKLSELPVTTHHWRPEVALIVDNWRVLHGRGASRAADFNRVLERLVIP